MNKDEIKKALELCQIGAISTCKDCPYTENCDGVRLYKDALELITEQENEIDLLQMQMKDVVNHADTFLAEANKIEAENKQLKEKLKNLKADFDSLQEDYEFVRDCDAEHCLEIDETVKQAKIDVLNELREKCKFDGHTVAVYKNDIDEMIEELKK